MRRIFTLILCFSLFCLSANAKIKNKNLGSILKESGIAYDSIAISVKNLDNGKVIYSQNDKILMHPASVQKMLTIVPIIDALGENYNLTTELYSRGSKEYIIKLGADPYLAEQDIKTLVKKIKPENIKKIYIDSSIIERKDWGEGWQWDDDLNPFMPRFNSYNLDGNILKFTVMPTEPGKQAAIINSSKYPIAFFNYVITGDSNDIKVSRNDVIASNAIKLEGTVKTPCTKSITNNNLKRYFEVKLTNALEDNKIYLKESIGTTKVLSTDKKIAEVARPIDYAVDDILKNSNNMAIETIAKIAGGKYYNKTGTDIDAINLFNNYFEKNGLNSKRIKFVDASGVSKNNLTDTDFITEFLIKNQTNKTLDKLIQPGVGTLSDRMLPLKNNVKAKTGTLADISSIAGYLTAQSGKRYAFCIIINDPSSTNSQKKSLEDYIVRYMYLKW